MLLPTHSIILRSNLTRNEIEERIKTVTYLSDANYTKPKDQTCLFYGNVSNQDFELENISDKSPLAPYVSADILGMDNNTYLKIKLSEWKHNRIAFLYITVISICTILFIKEWLNQYLWFAEIFKKPGYLEHTFSHKIYPENPVAWLVAIAILMSSYLYKKKVTSFENKIKPTTKFLEELLQANVIQKDTLPLVFH